MTTLDAAASARRADGGARTFVRRLYFYGMALISLIAALVAMDNLLAVLDQIWLGGRDSATLATVDTFTREAIAGNGGVLLVATPIFLLHWGAILRRRDAGELHSGMRKFFLYVASAVTVGYAAYHSYVLLRGIAQLAVGIPLAQSEIWPAGWLHSLLMVVMTLALQRYFLHIAATDGDLGQEVGIAGSWRRLYQTAAGLLGLTLTLIGGTGVVETLLRILFDYTGGTLTISTWRFALGDYIAQLILGTLFLHLNWTFWQRLASDNPREAQAALRRFYLYAAVVISALTVLLPLAELAGALILVLFGALAIGDAFVLDRMTTAVAAVPIGLYAWRWHWRFLQQEAATYGESTQGATIRRLYYYAVAATGLVVMWFGAIDLVQVAIDLATGQPVAAGQPFWLEPLASGLSRLLIAAPIWAFHWQATQRTARREDEVGQAERASGPRKVYLYGVALASGLIILFYLAQVAYRALLILLGDSSASFVGAEAASDLARSAIAAVIWTVHVLAIRRDGQMGADPVEEAPALIAVDEQRAMLEARINLLEIELRAAREELAALHNNEPPTGQAT
jgi:hypothetical protein